MSRTAMLITPSLEEVQLAAAKMGLPDTEAKKFFFYNESRGWRVNGKKMVNFVSAMRYWQLVYQDRVGGNGANGNGQSKGKSDIVRGEAIERLYRL